MSLVAIDRALAAAVAPLRFAPPVTHTYHPLQYAWAPHEAYLRRFGANPKEVVLVGMNPGPWGMAQTGIPFGEVGHVRDWMGIEGVIDAPAHPHPKRPVLGWACARSEVSGARLWGWARARFGTPDAFFRRFFVLNYCPLLFLEASGRNRTPDKLARAEREALTVACDRALAAAVGYLAPKFVVGVGAYAARQVARVCADTVGKAVCGQVLHPSPASPRANRGWAAQAEKELAGLGIRLG
ncbi:MAG: uracil-DNA glycosylase family protein [Myxococcota bacterium]